MLYQRNGDRIVTIDSVTSLHPMYTHVPNNFASFSSCDCDMNEALLRRSTEFGGVMKFPAEARSRD